MSIITDNLKRILLELPPEVLLVAAGKAQPIEKIQEAVSAGVKIIGENYIQEAQAKYAALGNIVKWHFIGHLQKNKVKTAVKIFDMIETAGSLELAGVLDRECAKINKVMPVLIEINSAAEPQKSGILFEDVDSFIEQAVELPNIKLQGLMTMGPLVEDPEKLRPYFKKAKECFDRVAGIYGNQLDWKYLSMGMSDSYKIAIEEGANIVRLGTAIFGSRE
jgi:pyridoxal phosphate enzyme (YggS family)